MRRELARAAQQILHAPGYVALQVFGNAALIGLAAAWLWIPESHGWQLAASFVTASVLILGALWLHAATMARWSQPSVEPPAWRRALPHLPAFCIWLLAGLVGLSLVQLLDERQMLYAGYLASRPSAFFRAWFTYPRLFAAIGLVVAALAWYVLPALLLPFASETAARGLRRARWSRCGRVLLNWRWWIVLLALVLIGVYLPLRLMNWTPGEYPVRSVRAQISSVAFRLALAYLLAVASWIASLSFVGALLGKEAEEAAAPEASSE